MIKTKITPPQRRSIILSRTRLLEQFDNVLDYSLFFVFAHAGYGKTSLLTDVASRLDAPVCWYSLDELDRDHLKFFHHFIHAIQARFPQFGSRALSALQTNHIDLDQWFHVFLNELEDRIREHHIKPFVFVLDDYHLVADVEPINTFISRLAKYDSPCHLIISSRAIIELPDILELVQKSRVTGLNMQALSFTSVEIKKLLKQNYGRDLSDAEANSLVSSTDGWITGILLTSHLIQKEKGIYDHLTLLQSTGQDLGLYLTQQVFEHQPNNIKQFLLQTSLFNQFDSNLCERILNGRTDYHTVLSRVVQQNLFITSIDETGFYQYHQLFRDFLQNKMELEYPTDYKRILYRLADVCIEQNDLDHAFNIYDRLKDDQAKIKIVLQHGLALIKQGRQHQLARYIDELCSDEPSFLALKGYITVFTESDTKIGLKLLNKAIQNEKHPQFFLWRSMCYRYLDDHDRAIKDAEEAIKLSPDLAEAYWAKGFGLRLKGKFNEAIEYYQQSLAIRPSNPVTLNDLGLTYELLGLLPEALNAYRQAYKEWIKTEHVVGLAYLLNNMGVLYYKLGDYQQAVIHLEQALTWAHHGVQTRVTVLALISLGDVYAALDALQAARDAYGYAEILLGKIDYPLAARYLNIALASINSDPSNLKHKSTDNYQVGLSYLTLGKIATNKNQAVSYFEQALSYFEVKEHKPEIEKCRLALALLKDKNIQNKTMNESLIHFVRSCSILKNKLNKSSISNDIAKFEELLPKHRRQVRQVCRTVLFDPPYIKILTLGRLQVVVGDEEINWQYNPVRNLFCLFLTYTHGLTKEQIGTFLWPEASEKQLSQRFNRYLTLLRQTMGPDAIIRHDHYYKFNWDMDYSFDAQIILESKEQTPNTWETIVNLYKGDFLIEINDIWILPFRENLNRMYQQATLRLTNHYFEIERYEKALDIAQHALSHDPCFEEMHRLIMKIYAQQGNRANIVRQFKQCQTAFNNLFGLSPSPETETLYYKLIPTS